MSIKSFKNQLLFIGLIDPTFKVSTINGGYRLISLTVDEQKSALLFDGDINIEINQPYACNLIFNEVVYNMSIDEGYDGKEFAIIDKNRLSARFTLDISITDASQVITSTGHDSVSPEIRRLSALGYL